MPHPFDAVSKHLTDVFPRDWNTLAELPAGTSVRVLDADLSTVSAAADKLIRVDGPNPYISHHEIQAGPRPYMDSDMLFYAAVARRHYRIPVWSTLFALRPAALTGLTGGVSEMQDPEHKLDFRYKIIRVWELSPAKLLAGGLGTLPLAPLSAVTEAQLPGIVDAVGQRINAEAAPSEVPELWMAMRVLMGVRWPRPLIHQVMKGAKQMKESVIYQEILEEGIEKGIKQGVAQGVETGRISELRSMIVRRGEKTLGPADSSVRSGLDVIGKVEVLEDLFDRMLDGRFATWNELLGSAK